MTSLPLTLLLVAAQAAVPGQTDTSQASAAADTSSAQPDVQLDAPPAHQVVTLPGGFATVSVPPSFRYLSPAAADPLLAEMWEVPDGQTLLGLLLPPGVTSLEDSAGWGIVITYEAGHVSDEDAAGMDYRALLRSMREASDGELLGWAVPPEYDRERHILSWANELDFGGGPMLEYNLRMLGRAGVLHLTAAAAWMSQLAEVESCMIELRGAVDFTDGHRYADFDKATDRMATYGFGALVAGNAAVTGGGVVGWVVNVVLRRVIYKVKKFIAAVVVAGLAVLWKVVTGRREQPAPAPVSRPRPPLNRPPGSRPPPSRPPTSGTPPMRRPVGR
ncbi:MAG: DUF2167 domain-containing protein [Gemmatimonadales bacterium]